MVHSLSTYLDPDLTYPTPPSLHGVYLRQIERQESRRFSANNVYHPRFVYFIPPTNPSLMTFISSGEKVFPEMELTHLDGHKGSKPVRIGNGAIDHIQLVRTLHKSDGKS